MLIASIDAFLTVEVHARIGHNITEQNTLLTDFKNGESSETRFESLPTSDGVEERVCARASVVILAILVDGIIFIDMAVAVAAAERCGQQGWACQRGWVSQRYVHPCMHCILCAAACAISRPPSYILHNCVCWVAK